jgi:hypothetical protein
MKRLSLTIPKPCAEKWNNFTPTQTGGFCASCSKNVIDFTKLTDEQILDFFHTRPAHACGRFKPDQLKAYSLLVRPTFYPNLKLLRAGVISLFVLFMSKPSHAQNPDIKAKSEDVRYQGYHDEQRISTNQKHIVKGAVKSEDGETLPGVSIYLKNGETGTTTDANGQFQFPAKLKEGDVLYFSFIGYDTQQYTVPKGAQDVIEIEMSLGYVMLMGEVVVEGAYVPDSSAKQTWWQKIAALF